MLPDVASTIVPPGCNSPDSTAAWIIAAAIRSLTEPPGLKYSNLAKIFASAPYFLPKRVAANKGVLPINSTKDFAILDIIVTPY